MSIRCHQDDLKDVAVFYNVSWTDAIGAILEDCYHQPVKNNIDIGNGWIVVGECNIGRKSKLFGDVFVKIKGNEFYCICRITDGEGDTGLWFCGAPKRVIAEYQKKLNSATLQITECATTDLDLTGKTFVGRRQSIEQFLNDFKQDLSLIEDEGECEQWL